MPVRRNSTRHVEGHGRRVVGGNATEDASYLTDILNRLKKEADRTWRYWTGPDNDVEERSKPIPIEVVGVEFYCKENAKDHHTTAYDVLDGERPSPVLRRGQPFYLALRFNRALDFGNDKIRLKFMFGPNKSQNKGNLAPLLITTNKSFTKDSTQWDVCTSRIDDNMVIVNVQVPPTTGVGLWRLKVVTKLANIKEKKIFVCKENIYMLFNPWCKEDQVYMPQESWKNEYVLNDVGKVFQGSYKNPVGRPWVFGQFERAVLPACIFLLENSGLDFTSRGNPIKVVRAISAMVNCNDDDGVIVGNWSGNYEDGTAPYVWSGSAGILEQYLTSSGTPVSYGQCWVFSAVTTTVCRALGIPCRCVTNYLSAHDTDDTLTIDYYFDSNGEKLRPNEKHPEYNRDSIWNFHVWNDCWMARPDLPPGYGGWQAVDATPQETSEGLYRAGPASVAAIKRGEISFQYDAPFVFAEVNADVVHWQKDKSSDSGLRRLSTNKSHVGRKLVTKGVGNGGNYFEDITHEYKSQEGTTEERMAIMNAARRLGKVDYHEMPKPENEDVSMKLRDIDSVMIGQPFRVTVEVKNLSDQKRTVDAILTATTVYYTGITASVIKKGKGSFTLKPKQKEVLSIQVTSDEYLEKLVDYSMMKIYAIATVKETKQTWADEDDFVAEKPVLKIETDEEIKVKKPFKLLTSFKNPLNKTLQDCEISIEGPGLAEPRRTKLNDIEPNGILNHVENLIPRKPGEREITAIFSSRQLIEVTGTKHVEIKE